MSPIAALRSRHSLEDLPPLTSDDDLIAWSRSLVRESADVAIDNKQARTAPAAPLRRREPLRAVRRASSEIRAARTDGFITADEIFDEIRERVTART